MPPDDFVANTRIPFEDLKIGSTNDIWVDLEPHGQLHVAIELHGSSVEGRITFIMEKLIFVFDFFLATLGNFG
ncbi:hypothetical protein GCK32_015343 [Trichostrongylus colubriformis]|uniref:Uncharacterized protein n=1 Tax=Trichostrongylus colubriformis TaxID=6319 RepID=A0AAN8FJ05_TRICO